MSMPSNAQRIGTSPGQQQQRSMTGSPTKRKEMDLMKLMISNYEVTTNGDSAAEFWVKFHGPKDTPYEGGQWQVHVELPENYPYKSPSIGFANRMFHPNVDEISGTVCLDVINQTWSPMYDLVNVFEVFLPQLLAYPNPTDPLNGEAAALMLRDPKRFADRCKEYVARYATADYASCQQQQQQNSSNNIHSSSAHTATHSSSSSSDCNGCSDSNNNVQNQKPAVAGTCHDDEDDDLMLGGSDSEIENLEL